MPVWRSLMYVPVNVEKYVDKAHTRGADCNLDGVVNSDDVTIVGGDYNAGGTGEWFLGDFDYDGICDGDDVTVLGALYDPTAPPLSSSELTARFGSETGVVTDA